MNTNYEKTNDNNSVDPTTNKLLTTKLSSEKKKLKNGMNSFFSKNTYSFRKTNPKSFMSEKNLSATKNTTIFDVMSGNTRNTKTNQSQSTKMLIKNVNEPLNYNIMNKSPSGGNTKNIRLSSPQSDIFAATNSSPNRNKLEIVGEEMSDMKRQNGTFLLINYNCRWHNITANYNSTF